ncbi:MAG: hypothetical protein N2035_04410 [Chthoniobacterales bacterium]|nr:hypothetical protein [Chthoniobacterales bacterium]
MQVLNGFERICARIDSEQKSESIFSEFPRIRSTLEKGAEIGSNLAMFLLGKNLKKANQQLHSVTSSLLLTKGTPKLCSK